jgi:hypothetical protein
MYDTALPFPIGKAVASSNASMAAFLGTLWMTNDGKMYRVCQANGAIAAAARKVATVGILAGAPTWKVAIDGTAANAYKQMVRVLIPTGQVGSTGTTGLVNGDYFWAQVSGHAVALSAAALGTGGSVVLVVNTLGYLKASTQTTALAARAAFALPTHSAATTGANIAIGVQLVGLV